MQLPQCQDSQYDLGLANVELSTHEDVDVWFLDMHAFEIQTGKRVAIGWARSFTIHQHHAKKFKRGISDLDAK